MTRKEFLEQMAKQCNYFYNSDGDRVWEALLNRIQSEFDNDINIDFLYDFLFCDGFNGSIAVWRYGEKTDDELYFHIACNYKSFCFWDDIGQYASEVVFTSIYNFVIERFYLSEDGRFWDENHKLRFQSEEELFDYLMSVEYDFHPVISKKTYEMMQHFGWYEGRRVDTSELERELKKHDITLSQIQLDAISEFSGLEFLFSRSSWNLEFNSIERMVDDLSCNKLNFKPEVYDFYSKRLIGKNVLEFGLYDMGYFSISEDGKIFFDGDDPRGRTILELIYAFEKDIPNNVKWL